LPAQAASADILNLTAGVFPDDQLSALSSTGDPFAVGGGTVGNASGTHFAFAAHLSPNGPSGYAVVSDPALGEAQGHVCAYLPATTNDARFSINVEKGSGFLGSVSNLDFVVEDGGEPPSGADLFVVEAALGCQGQAHGGTGGPVVQGNIVVKNP
jgi:hypothetical protein